MGRGEIKFYRTVIRNSLPYVGQEQRIISVDPITLKIKRLVNMRSLPLPTQVLLRSLDLMGYIDPRCDLECIDGI